MKQVLGCVRRADEKFNMIENGDKVCVGVSGGKDSLLLMYALKLYQNFSKNHFDILAVTLDLGIEDIDYGPIMEFADRIDVEYKLIHTDIGKVVFEMREERSPCALCAKLRRGALNNAAVENGCHKVALGHNRDDVIETFFLSLLYESRINTFAPVTYLSRKDVTVIRPLVYLPEKNALATAKRLSLPVLPPHCKIAGTTKREEAKQILKYLCKLVPDADSKILHAINETDQYGLWDKMRLKDEIN